MCLTLALHAPEVANFSNYMDIENLLKQKVQIAAVP
jgi:hypothetical protein